MTDAAHLDAMLRVAVGAVADACRVCRGVQADLERVRSITKDDKSPVTVADFASQAVVLHRLRAALGEAPMIAEENADALRSPEAAPVRDAVRLAARTVWPEAETEDVLGAIDLGRGRGIDEGFWTLDPIDGTKGFLRGQQYAVSLAWVEGGEPVLGVLGCPNLPVAFDAALDRADPSGSIYSGRSGGGVFEIPADGSSGSRAAAPRPVSSRPYEPGRSVRMCESVESAHTNKSASAGVLASIGDHAEPARLDGQGKYAVVARGQADAYLRLPTKKGYVERIWDHAAGDLIAREGGCVVTDVRGERLDFSHGAGLERNSGVVCAVPGLHEQLVAAIGRMGVGPTN